MTKKNGNDVRKLHKIGIFIDYIFYNDFKIIMMKRTGYQNIFSDEKKIISLDEF